MSSSSRYKHRKPQLLVKVPPNDADFDFLATDISRDLSPYVSTPEHNKQQVVSPSRYTFETITQLPTPILNNKPLRFSPIDNSPLIDSTITNKNTLNDSEIINIDKPRHSDKPQVFLTRNRAVSEYKPIDRQIYTDNLRLSEHPQNDYQGNSVLGPAMHSVTPVVGNKRIISNPIPSNPKTPSPPPINDSQLIRKYQTKMFLVKGEEFRFVKIIGTGNFSHVLLVSNGDIEIAVKIISIPIKSKSQIKNFKYFIKRELNILHSLQHPNIVRLLDYDINLRIDHQEILDGVETESEIESEDNQNDDIENDDDYRILQQDNDQLIYINYCQGGNLLEFLSTNHKIYYTSHNYWKVIGRIVKEVINAVAYLHDNHIVHRDIKLENVLLNYHIDQLLINPHLENITCLTDFGLAKRIQYDNQLLSTRCGSTDYISPEILMGVKYNGEITDAWSIGVLIYCLLEDRLPFDLPPYNYLINSGISPSVIKRKMSKNSPAHRIAMIDWGWYAINDLLPYLNKDTIGIINNLKEIVELLLVRKDKRFKVRDLLMLKAFKCI